MKTNILKAQIRKEISNILPALFITGSLLATFFAGYQQGKRNTEKEIAKLVSDYEQAYEIQKTIKAEKVKGK